MQTLNVEVLIGTRREYGMKIISKRGTWDSDPSLRMTPVLESGITIIYADKPDNTIHNIWKRSVM